MSRVRYFIAIVISRLPLSFLRVFFYNIIFGYRIKESKVGYGTIIDVDDAFIYKSNIGKFNRFVGPMEIKIDEYSKIGSYNIFECGSWTKQIPDNKYKRKLEIGKNTLITGFHYFDIAGWFLLSCNSWIAGRSSEFWTHGAGVKDRDIKIGKDCYVGSAVKFVPGSEIGDSTLVGLGSVVTKKFNDHLMIAGVPAKIIKEKYNWKTEEFIR